VTSHIKARLSDAPVIITIRVLRAQKLHRLWMSNVGVVIAPPCDSTQYFDERTTPGMHVCLNRDPWSFTIIHNIATVYCDDSIKFWSIWKLSCQIKTSFEEAQGGSTIREWTKHNTAKQHCIVDSSDSRKSIREQWKTWVEIRMIGLDACKCWFGVDISSIRPFSGDISFFSRIWRRIHYNAVKLSEFFYVG